MKQKMRYCTPSKVKKVRKIIKNTELDTNGRKSKFNRIRDYFETFDHCKGEENDKIVQRKTWEKKLKTELSHEKI